MLNTCHLHKAQTEELFGRLCKRGPERSLSDLSGSGFSLFWHKFVLICIVLLYNKKEPLGNATLKPLDKHCYNGVCQKREAPASRFETVPPCSDPRKCWGQKREAPASRFETQTVAFEIDQLGSQKGEAPASRFETEQSSPVIWQPKRQVKREKRLLAGLRPQPFETVQRRDVVKREKRLLAGLRLSKASVTDLREESKERSACEQVWSIPKDHNKRPAKQQF